MSEYVVEFVGGPWDGKLHGFVRKSDVPAELAFHLDSPEAVAAAQGMPAENRPVRIGIYARGTWTGKGRGRRSQLVFVWQGEEGNT